MKKTQEKTSKGITLVALVITIIVLLILAGVSISMVLGNNSLIGKTQKSVNTYKEKAEEEKDLLKQIENYLDDALANVKGEVNFSLLDDADSSGGLSIGDEITDSKGENYFVLKDDGTIVTLITKYNLNQAGTAQQNAPYGTTACAFSSTNYWATDWETWKAEYDADNTIALLNLNDKNGYAAGDAIDKAKKYGTSKGAIGRLLTDEESKKIDAGANANLKKILYGQNYATNPVETNNYLYYWRASVSKNENINVCRVRGDNSTLQGSYYYVDNVFGVRPVIEIAKSKIS